MHIKQYRIFVLSLLISAVVISAKYLLHYLEIEIITLGSLHTSVIAGTFFVIGFLLSATIADYKESERIPAEAASILENMHEDAKSIKTNYPNFDMITFQKRLLKVATKLASDIRHGKHEAHSHIHTIAESFSQMEAAGVPANFIVKLKQQQAQLLRNLLRVNYIQRITFIPSATILAWAIVTIVIVMLLATEIEPFFAGVLLVTGISFILIYMLLLLRVIRTPFHSAGSTRDDVSLFLLDDAVAHIKRK